jgi:hypothetical protein
VPAAIVQTQTGRRFKVIALTMDEIVSAFLPRLFALGLCAHLARRRRRAVAAARVWALGACAAAARRRRQQAQLLKLFATGEPI